MTWGHVDLWCRTRKGHLFVISLRRREPRCDPHPGLHTWVVSPSAEGMRRLAQRGWGPGEAQGQGEEHIIGSFHSFDKDVWGPSLQGAPSGNGGHSGPLVRWMRTSGMWNSHCGEEGWSAIERGGEREEEGEGEREGGRSGSVCWREKEREITKFALQMKFDLDEEKKSSGPQWVPLRSH